MLWWASVYQKGLLDQWVFIHLGLFSVCFVTEQVCNNLFYACNMDPISMVPFPAWRKNIYNFLQADQLFKSEEPAYMYCLFTFMWHDITPEKNIQMDALINAHGGEVSVDLCKSLHI